MKAFITSAHFAKCARGKPRLAFASEASG